MHGLTKADHPWRTAAILFFGSLAIHSAFLAPSGFDGLYGQDAYSYYSYAVGPLRTALLHFQPPPPYFWPPGYPLPIAFGALIFGASPLIGQWVSLLAGSLVTVLTFALAREVVADLNAGQPYRWAPLAAAAVTIFHPQLWQSSIVVMSDTLSLAAGTLGAWALARYARLNRARWLALSAAALAYAIATRWAYALEAIPCALYGVYLLINSARGQTARMVRSALGASLSGGVVLAALIGPGLLAHSASTAFTGDLEVYSWSPINIFKRTFTTIDGVQTYRLWNGLYYVLSPGHPDYFTPLLALLLAPGLWRLWKRRRATPLVLLLAWPVMILGFHAGAPWQNFRFTLAALPPLAVIVGLGAVQAAVWLGWVATERVSGRGAFAPPAPLVGGAPAADLGLDAVGAGTRLGPDANAGRQVASRADPIWHRPNRVGPNAQVETQAGSRADTQVGPYPSPAGEAWLGAARGWIILALVLPGLVWQAIAGYQLTQQFIARKLGDLAIVAGVDAQAPADAQLLTFSMTGAFSQYSPLDTHELWGLDTSQVAALVNDGRPTFVLLDVVNVETQWQGLSPANNYHWLRDGPGLEPLEQFSSYTFFRVRPR